MPELAGGWGGSVRRNSTELAGLAAELAMELAGLVMELSQPEPSSMQPQGDLINTERERRAMV